MLSLEKFDRKFEAPSGFGIGGFDMDGKHRVDLIPKEIDNIIQLKKGTSTKEEEERDDTKIKQLEEELKSYISLI